MALLLFYIGLVNVEGDEHKLQVRFCFKIRFVRELLSKTLSSAKFWLAMLGYRGFESLTLN